MATELPRVTPENWATEVMRSSANPVSVVYQATLQLSHGTKALVRLQRAPVTGRWRKCLTFDEAGIIDLLNTERGYAPESDMLFPNGEMGWHRQQALHELRRTSSPAFASQPAQPPESKTIAEWLAPHLPDESELQDQLTAELAALGVEFLRVDDRKAETATAREIETRERVGPRVFTTEPKPPELSRAVPGPQPGDDIMIVGARSAGNDPITVNGRVGIPRRLRVPVQLRVLGFANSHSRELLSGLPRELQAGDSVHVLFKDEPDVPESITFNVVHPTPRQGVMTFSIDCERLEASHAVREPVPLLPGDRLSLKLGATEVLMFHVEHCEPESRAMAPPTAENSGDVNSLEPHSLHSVVNSDVLDTQPETLSRELASLLNRFSAENDSNTPDFMLATFLIHSLEAFNATVRARESWYGRNPDAGPGVSA